MPHNANRSAWRLLAINILNTSTYSLGKLPHEMLHLKWYNFKFIYLKTAFHDIVFVEYYTVLRICAVSVTDFAVVESGNVQYTEIISVIIIIIIMYNKLKM